ncbi:porin [Delftia acidovorans]|uniref:porin n=1 Tax=Delftia acidovorans TaxID=80866 RepID=UPI001EFE1BAF|nr:porin [Delftia acidovorans]MCG8990069.1 porin [Delftia acidovorans]
MPRLHPHPCGLHALGLLCLAGAAAAQAPTSVTLFGVMDAGVSRYSVRSESWDAGPARSARHSTWALSPSGNLASRIGIRASEDLGGGLMAGLWLEAPVANDTGGGALNFGRRATISLSGRLGELRMGRDHTPSFLNDWAFDPFTVNGVGTNLIAVVNSNLAIARALATGGLLGGGLSAGTDTYLRAGNSIGYFLPPGLGGVYGQAMYAFPENSSKRGRYAGARIGWAMGAADVALGYGENTLGTSGAGAEKIRSLNLGGSYDFGPVKLFGEWSGVRNERRDAGTLAAINDRYLGALAGVNIPVGQGALRASYARVQFRNGQGLADGDSSVNKLALGYVRPLSKRTALYATVSRISVGNGRNNPGVMGVTPLVVSNPAILPQPGYLTTGGMQPAGALGLDLGLRLMF